MDYENIWNRLIEEAKMDVDYQRGLLELGKKQEAYLAVCDVLTSEQVLAVEEYIAACEELGDYMALVSSVLFLSIPIQPFVKISL